MENYSGRIKTELDHGKGEITIPHEILPYLHFSPQGLWEAENPQGWSRNTENMRLLRYTLVAGREKVLKYFQSVSGKAEVLQAQSTRDLYDLVTSGLKPAEKKGWFAEK